jgi:two-component system CheB/CheR fusion protein
MMRFFGRIGMREEKTGSEIDVVVWDSGIGIAPENMEKLFEGFFRVDTPYSQVTEWIGLGKGTSVRFTLPIVSRKAV